MKEDMKKYKKMFSDICVSVSADKCAEKKKKYC